jgi:hypothetical protein
VSDTLSGGAGHSSAPNRGDPSAHPKISEEDQLHDNVIFAQELNEVYLLIDFVSGRADRNLSTLTMPNPNKGAEGESDEVSSGVIVKKIAAMRYPPDPKTPVANAENAAILLLAKDRLNALAHPARGLTIAYTMMFADSEARARWFGLWRHRRRAANHPNHPDRPRGDSRIAVAGEAFPGLRRHARRFRTWRDGLAFFSVIWLGLTAFTYWDVGLGRSVLQRLDQNWKNLAAAQQANPELIADPACQSMNVNNNSPGLTPEAGHALPLRDATPIVDDAKRTLACQNLARHNHGYDAATHEVKRVFRCEGVALSLFHVWCWRWVLLSADPEQPNGLDNTSVWQAATSSLSVFTTYILPMMFALLGTLIGAFRSIVKKVRDSELAPRDFMRMRLGVPTGLVAGVAVGLFLSPSSVPLEGAGGVGGEFTLTASGLGFLAGYASQRFFTYLDNVMETVFPYSSSTRTPPSRQPGGGGAGTGTTS